MWWSHARDNVEPWFEACERVPSGPFGGRSGLSATATLLVEGWVLVVAGMLVRRSDVGSVVRRRGDLAAQTQHFEEEEPDPVWALAQLRRLGLGLVTVSHANPVCLIRIPRPSTHVSNASGEGSCRTLLQLSPGPPDGRESESLRWIRMASGRMQNPGHVPTMMKRIVSIGGHDICEIHSPAH
jgi:hypothetical protein